MEKFHKPRKDRNKDKKKNYDSDEDGGKANFKKRNRNRNNRDKYKKFDKDDENYKQEKNSKLKFYIDEKGRKKYDFSGGNINDKKESNKSNTNLSLNEEKKKLIFPPADERTFLKKRDESELVDVEKFKGMILPVSNDTNNTLNAKNKKEIDEKISALGVFIPAENKEAHRGDVFYCKTCDCVLKDNSAYIEHLNGKKRELFFQYFLNFFTKKIYIY
jgi:hypothetical protein